MSNQIETVDYEGGKVSFDHSSGHMRAVWPNGYSENWPPRGYDVRTKFESFLVFTDQWERREMEGFTS